MAVASSDSCRWQNDKHRIQYCGPSTGHAVQNVAMCDNTTTAQMLVTALEVLQRVDLLDRTGNCVLSSVVRDNVRTVLNQAGLLPG